MASASLGKTLPFGVGGGCGDYGRATPAAVSETPAAPSAPLGLLQFGKRRGHGRWLRGLWRPALGLLAQPFSCIGLPVATAPVFRPGTMPLGVQIVAPPWREDLCLRAAAALEARGVAAAHPPARLAA